MIEKPVITFDETSKVFILHAFGVTVDANGYLVMETDQDTKILTEQGDPITLNEFAGIHRGKNGSPTFIKKDIISLIELIDK